MTIYELWNSIIFLKFKTSLVITSPSLTHQRHYHALRTEIDIWLTPFKIVPIYAHESSKPISLIKRRIEYLTKALLPRFSKIIIIIFQVSVKKSFTAIWEWLHSWNWVFLISKYWQDRPYSSSLLRVIVACNHLPFFKSFSSFVHFCANFQILCPFTPILLLSRIDPAKGNM